MLIGLIRDGSSILVIVVVVVVSHGESRKMGLRTKTKRLKG
jgi:hypothetical protein